MPRQQFLTRPWRAVHDPWLSSERLGAASDRAVILWHMLNTRQDDAGRFHWTPVRVLTLVALRRWTFAQASEYLADLARVGSVTIVGEWVTLHRGADFNGVPKAGTDEWKKPRLYPDTNSVSTESVPNTYSVRTESVSGTEPITAVGTERNGTDRNGTEDGPQTSFAPSSKSETPTKKQKISPHLTDLETSELHAEYDAALTADRVTSEIAASLDHEAAYKRGKSGSWKLYVQTWLRRSAAPPAVFRPSPPSANGSAPPNKYDVERERIAKLGVASHVDS